MHCQGKTHCKFPSVHKPHRRKIATVLSLCWVCLSSAEEPLHYCTSLSCRYVFSRGTLPLIESSLIPFAAIILSLLLNGRDSIIPHNRTQSNWLANLREPPPEPVFAGPCQKDLEKVWPYDECIYDLECVLGRTDCVGIRKHTKRGLTDRYCWGQKQTVVKISASFRCLVLPYPLLSWPLWPCFLSIGLRAGWYGLQKKCCNISKLYGDKR